MRKNSMFLWLECVAILIIVIAFFVISYCGFFTWDDIWMNHGVSTLSDVFEHTKMFYLTYGGRMFSVASQYLFSGVLGDNRIWFDIVNTMFFVLLIMTCGKLIGNGKKPYFHYVLMFALLFWFLCPVPSETFFLTAASTTYLWANTLSFVFLLFFQKYNNYNFKVIGKLGLFIMSFFAATEFITCASVCGAFVVYYAFHIKEFKGNVVPFVIGFAMGSMVLLFAPGNFERLSNEIGVYRPMFDISYLLHHLFQEAAKFKALWLFLIVFVWGWINNKAVVKVWVKNNSILLLSLGWSVIAFCVVFSSPWDRALFFTEALALVLFLRFLYNNYGDIKFRILNKFLSRNICFVKIAVIVLLFVAFMVDSIFAVVETKRQSYNNDVILKELVDSGSFFAWQDIVSFHRMAYVPIFHVWAKEALAEKYDLDSIHNYPYYCLLEKYYNQTSPLENVYVEIDDYNRFAKEVRLIVRIENEKLQGSSKSAVFTIDYTRPRKWYKSWLDKWYNYQYDRTAVVEIDYPDVCFDGYCYYVIWFGRENAKNLKSVKYEIE